MVQLYGPLVVNTITLMNDMHKLIDPYTDDIIELYQDEETNIFKSYPQKYLLHLCSKVFLYDLPVNIYWYGLKLYNPDAFDDKMETQFDSVIGISDVFLLLEEYTVYNNPSYAYDENIMDRLNLLQWNCLMFEEHHQNGAPEQMAMDAISQYCFGMNMDESIECLQRDFPITMMKINSIDMNFVDYSRLTDIVKEIKEINRKFEEKMRRQRNKRRSRTNKYI